MSDYASNLAAERRPRKPQPIAQAGPGQQTACSAWPRPPARSARALRPSATRRAAFRSSGGSCEPLVQAAATGAGTGAFDVRPATTKARPWARSWALALALAATRGEGRYGPRQQGRGPIQSRRRDPDRRRAEASRAGPLQGVDNAGVSLTSRAAQKLADVIEQTKAARSAHPANEPGVAAVDSAVAKFLTAPGATPSLPTSMRCARPPGTCQGRPRHFRSVRRSRARSTTTWTLSRQMRRTSSMVTSGRARGLATSQGPLVVVSEERSSYERAGRSEPQRRRERRKHQQCDAATSQGAVERDEVDA